jgi:transposase
MAKGVWYPKELKEEIIDKIKQGGKSAAQIARDYGINEKTVYNWLTKEKTERNPIIEINRLKRENEELLRIIGELTHDIKKNKKLRY